VEPFPFTEEEWQAVADAALPLVNATFAGDDVLRDSLFLELAEILSGLRQRHGDHPVLLETLADYTDDDAERIRLYRQAIDIAVRHGIGTYTIRLSLALLLFDRGEKAAARAELEACRDEIFADGDQSQRDWWECLRAECSE
jgi:hypothetical protein